MIFLKPPQRSKQQIARAKVDAERTALAVRTAVLFTTIIYCNREYMRLESATLAEARAKKITLEISADNGRRALVYAVTPDRFTHLVPDHFNNGENR